MSHFNKDWDKNPSKKSSPPHALTNDLMKSLRMFGILRKVTVILEQRALNNDV
jgi:hypothetical protein